ncbi:VCBS domain-containing protein [Endozoicomonas sp. 8E]|uniref:VCBS domain-containing protein n=1 Tax=Endozoicomonas sp. 8E TaxID=3035692 RepID=UPI0029391332|nr:VCBS domain-containing protein [Endozoicomonas sp. 8E]WOG27332.1 VCBS domain-containing protein [Endozoicomonas sp. 8E]
MLISESTVISSPYGQHYVVLQRESGPPISVLVKDFQSLASVLPDDSAASKGDSVQPANNLPDSSLEEALQATKTAKDHNDRRVMHVVEFEDGHHRPAAVVERVNLEVDISRGQAFTNDPTARDYSGFLNTDPGSASQFNEISFSNSRDGTIAPSIAGRSPELSENAASNNLPLTFVGSFLGQVFEDSQISAHGQFDLEGGESTIPAQAYQGKYGVLTIEESGAWRYTLDNSSSDVQGLHDGQRVSEYFVVHALNANGVNFSHALTVDVQGTNDLPVIHSRHVGHSIIEGASQPTTGSISFTDADTGDAATFSTPVTVAGFTLNADGTYSFDPADPAYDGIAQGDTQRIVIPLTVTDASGASDTKTLVMTISGTNDTPVLDQIQAQSATKGGSQLGGQITSQDPDAHASVAYSIATPVDGFTLSKEGHYAFDPGHTAYQSLATGQNRTLTIPITATDQHGATDTRDLVITVHGRSNAAVIAGADSGSVTEDSSIQVAGILSITDKDAGQDHFQAGNYTATHGSLYLDANGHWAYNLDNTHADVQALGAGATTTNSLTDTIQIQSADGTRHNIVITINGSNNSPVLNAISAASATEGASQPITGSITSTDVDTGDTATYSTKSTAAGFTLNADGTYSFDPADPAYDGLAQGDTQKIVIPVTVTDGSGATDTKALVMTVSGTNDAPVLDQIQAQSATEDGSQLSGQVTSQDPDNYASVAYSIAAPVDGFMLNRDGQYTFDPGHAAFQSIAAGQDKTLTIPVTATDQHGASDTRNLVITVHGQSDAAVIAGTDSGSVTEDSLLQVTGSLIITDKDAGQDHFQAGNYTATHGTLHLNANGHWAYNLDNTHADVQALGAGTTTTNSLTDRIQIQSADGTTHDIVITINGSNDGPLLNTISAASATEGGSQPTTGSITSADVDTGDTATYSTTATVAGFTLKADGSYSFDPADPTYNGLAQGDTQRIVIPVTVTDGSGATDTKALVMTVNGTNDAPVLDQIQAQSATEDGSQLGGQITSQDPDNHASVAYSVATPVDGFTLNKDGQYTFDPGHAAYQSLAAGQDKTLTIPITATDQHGATDTRNLVITVHGQSDAAVIAGADSGDVTEDSLLQVTGSLIITDKDAGQDHFQAGNYTATHGTLHLNANGHWAYNLDNTHADVQALGAGTTTTNSLTDRIQIQSADGTTHDIVITINGSNDGPVLNAISAASATEGDSQSTTGSITSTDVDTGDTATYSTTATVAGFTLKADGTYSFDPADPTYNGLAQGDTQRIVIPVTVTDGSGATDTKALVMTVSGTNDAPVLDQIQAQSATEDSSQLSGQITSQDPDDHASVVYSMATPVDGFMLNKDGQYTFDPGHAAYQSLVAGQDRTLTIPITVTDQHGATDTRNLVITVHGQSDAAVIAGADSGSVTEDSSLQVTGSLSITDKDTGQDHFQAGNFSATHGTLHLDANGHWAYDLDNTHGDVQALGAGTTTTNSLADRIPIQSADGTTHNIVITINGSNDGPVLNAISAASATEGDSQPTTGSITCADVDTGDTATYSTTMTVPGFTLNADGTYSFDPADPAYDALAQGDTQRIVIPVTVTDGSGATDTKALMMTVSGTNDAPVLDQIQTQSATENGSQLSGLITSQDPDNHASVAYSMATPVDGFTLNRDGQYTFDPGHAAYQSLAAGQDQTLTIPITVTDQHGASDTRNLVVTVHGQSNDAVIAGADSGSVTEDSSLQVTGILSITDNDAGQDYFQAGSYTAAHGTLYLNANGHWAYNLDNTIADVQALGAGTTTTNSLTDIIPIQSADGTTHDVVITINGSNDGPVLNAISAASATEGDSQLTTGSITCADVDTGDTATYSTTMTVSGFTLNADGTYSFDPTDPAYDGLAQGDTQKIVIPVTVTDGSGAADTKALVMTVSGTNDAPVLAQIQAQSATEDGSQLGGQITSQDPDNHASVAYSVATPVDGFTLNKDGQYTFDPGHAAYQSIAAGQDKTLTIPITATDQHGATDTRNLVITVHGQSDAAVIAGTDSGSVTEDSLLQVTGSLIITDKDAGQDHFQAGNYTATHGTLHLNANGHWAYNLDNTHADVQALGAGTTTTNSLTDRVQIQSADGTTHDIVITINGSNDGPVLNAISAASATEGDSQSTTGSITSVDVDTGDTATYSTTATVAGFTLKADGSYSFDPADPTYNGLAQGDTQRIVIPVTVTDGSGATDTKALVMTVSGTNDAPVLDQIQAQSATEDGSQLGGQITSQDPDNHASVAYSIATPVDGFTLNRDGQYTFDPGHAAYQSLATGQHKTLTIPITVTDQHGATDTGNLVITVHGQSDAAVIAGANSGSVTEDSSLQVTGSLSITDNDAGQDHFRAGNYTGTHGGLHLNANGHWSYNLDDTHADVQALGAGTTTTNSLTDRIPIQSADGTTHDIVVTINGSNDGPVLNAISAASAIEGDSQPTTGSITSTDVDTGDTATYSSTMRVPGFTLNADGNYSFDPADPAYDGLAQGDTQRIVIPVMVTDGSGATDTKALMMTVSGTNDAPTLSSTVVLPAGTEDKVVIIKTSDLLAHAADVDHRARLSIHNLSADHGRITDNRNGTYTFTPTANYNGPVQFSYEVQDEHQSSVAQTASMNLAAVDHLSVISGNVVATVAEGDIGDITNVRGMLTISDVDVGDNPVFPNVSPTATTYGHFTMVNGLWTYLLDQSKVQDLNPSAPDASKRQVADSYTFTASDGNAQTVNVAITGTNDAPTIATVALSGTEDIAYTFSPTDFGFQDVDAGAVLDHVTITRLPVASEGKLQLNGADVTVGQNIVTSAIPNLVFTPAANFHGDVHFAYTVNDGKADSAEATGNISVSSIVDAATLSTSATPVGDEDKAIALNLVVASHGDTPESITLTGFLAGTQFSSGQSDGSGGWVVNASDVSSLTLTPPANYQGSMPLYVTAKTSDGTHSVTSPPQTVSVTARPVTDAASVALHFTAEQKVMTFGSEGTGGVLNQSQLDTPNLITKLAVEFNIIGSQQVATSAHHAATFLSYGVPADPNEFFVWRPDNLTIGIGRHEHATGIDTTDGNSHRYTILWDSVTGHLDVLVDGQSAYSRDNIATGYQIPGHGVFALAQDQDHYAEESGPAATGNHGFNPNSAYHGQMYSVSMAANVDVEKTLLAHSPLGKVIPKNAGLVFDIQADHSGTLVDVTGHHQLSQAGALTEQKVSVDTDIATPDSSALLHLHPTITPPSDPQDHISKIELTGFNVGTVLSDGRGHTHTVTQITEHIDVHDWATSGVTAQLPGGNAQNMDIRLVVTTTGAGGDAVGEHSEPLILDPTQPLPAPPISSHDQAPGSESSDVTVQQDRQASGGPLQGSLSDNEPEINLEALRDQNQPLASGDIDSARIIRAGVVLEAATENEAEDSLDRQVEQHLNEQQSQRGEEETVSNEVKGEPSRSTDEKLLASGTADTNHDDATSGSSSFHIDNLVPKPDDNSFPPI